MKTASAHHSSSLPVLIALAGDSTVADYAESEPFRGWGQMLPEFLDSSRVTVMNFAACGRSTKTFFSEGFWAKLLSSEPNIVFIQHGHNDSHERGLPESTDAATDYPENLRRYVADVRAMGALPVMVTPMHRCRWAEVGRALTTELAPYADAMRLVAAETGTPLIDLYAISGEEFVAMGEPALSQFLGEPVSDRTHFNAEGARYFAGHVACEAGRLVPGFDNLLATSR